MITYEGTRLENGHAFVCVRDGDTRLSLAPRRDLWNHSPDGFEWGYAGSGPAQLALAILAHALKDDTRAVRLHQAFKRDRIAGLDPACAWSIDQADVRAWAEHQA